jgi:Zn-dependent protease
MFPDLTIQLLVMRILAGVLIFTIHGFTVAGTAVLLGDKGPRYDQRLSLSPGRHIDMLGLGALVLAGFGWSRAVDIDPAQMRAGRAGPVIAALAGSAVLLVLALVLMLLVQPALTMLPYSAALTVSAFLRVTAPLCVWIALFSLLPLPPLAGAQLLTALGIRLPAVTGTIVGWILLVVSVLGVTRIVLAPVYQLVAPLLLGPDLR